MSKESFFDITLKRPICIPNVDEDDLRALVNALEISVKDSDFSGFVLSSKGIEVKFSFGSDGNFEGVTAKQDGKLQTIIPGSTSKFLASFEGPPSANNPGPGWEVVADLTQSIYGQPPNQNQWVIFFARRVNVLNTGVVA